MEPSATGAGADAHGSVAVIRRRLHQAVVAIAVVLAVPATARAEQYQYSMTARVRPLLLFWITRSGVGGATVTRERAAEYARYSLLIGSDPDRAPRRINRWGYIEEEIRGEAAHLIGLMTESDESSIEEADASLRAQSAGRHPFTIIQATVDGDRASSRVTTIAAPEDYTFRQLGIALDMARRDPAGGVSRTLRVPSGSRPGFLVALDEAIRTMSPGPIPYVYHGRLYELRQVRVRKIASAQAGGVAVGQAAAGDFVITKLKDGEETRFSMTYGTAGRFAGVPLVVTYQPRWWMQVELTIENPGASGLTGTEGAER